MALADIISRISTDAAAEARAIVEAAEARAQQALERAAAEDRARAEAIVEAAAREAGSEGASIVAGARLKARDDILRAKQINMARVLADAEAGLAELPGDAYTSLIAEGVAREALGADVVRVAPADADRLTGLKAAVLALEPSLGGLEFSDEPANVARGVVLDSGRVTSEVSPRTILAGRRQELSALAGSVLFGTRGSG